MDKLPNPLKDDDWNFIEAAEDYSYYDEEEEDEDFMDEEDEE